MVHAERVSLQAINHEVLPRLWVFNNDPELEIAGGGDPSLVRANRIYKL